MSTIQSTLGYNVRKGFLNPYENLFDGHFQRKLDEPTYLSFSIDFGNFLRAYMPGAWTADLFTHTNYDELPQALFCPPSNDTKDWNAREQYCAYSYLLDRDEKLRAGMLEEFLIGWDELQRDFQYYFQEISGLDSLLKVDPKAGIRIKDGKIKIKCLEGLDLKVKYLLNLYRKIAWDDTYQRWILPDIYRYFNMYIYITEIRQFHQSNLSGSYANEVSQLTPGTESNNKKKLVDFNFNLKGILSGGKTTNQSGEQLILSVIDNMLPTIRIKCNMCEFVLDSWLKDSYSINNDQMEETTFEISVKNIEVDQQYKLNGYDNLIKDSYDRVLIRRAKDYNWNDNESLESWYAYSQRLINLPEQDRKHNYNTNETSGSSKTWLSNAFEWGKAWLGNKIENAVDRFMTKDIIGNLSMVGIINALQSKDLVTAFGAVRLATQSKGYVPSQEITGYDLMTSVIQGIASSTATSPEQELIINSAKEMLQEPNNIRISSQIPEEEILRKLADYQLGPIYEKQTNYDKSHATDLDGGPDGNLIPNHPNSKTPDMNLVANAYNLDRSTATDLDGGPDGNLIENIHNPEKQDMNLVENGYEGDRSVATDLDGSLGTALTENIHNPEKPDMFMVLNGYEGDRSVATDLDGGPDGDLISNYLDPSIAPMSMTYNSHEGDRSVATDLDGGPDKNLTTNYNDPSIAPMDLTENHYFGDRSESTDLDGGPDTVMLGNPYFGDRSEATDLDGGPVATMISNLYDGDRSLATDLDGSLDMALTENIHNPEKTGMDMIHNNYEGDRSTATDLDGSPDKNLVPNYNDPKKPDMFMTYNNHSGDRSLATDLDEYPIGTLTSNQIDPKNSESYNLIHNQEERKDSNYSEILTYNNEKVSKVNNTALLENTQKKKERSISDVIPNVSNKDHKPNQSLNLNSYEEKPRVAGDTMWNNISSIENQEALNTLVQNIDDIFNMEKKSVKITENKVSTPKVEQDTMVSNAAPKAKVEKMKLVSNHYNGPVSLATSNTIKE